MYIIALDLHSEFENQSNPKFSCESLDELITIMKFFFANGYDVLVKELDE